MESDDLPDNAATQDDVRAAVEALSKVDVYRIHKAARYCLPGTEYQDPQELVNEAIMRTMNAAVGGKGRHWPKNVPFIAYMIRTIQGIANDSLESAGQKKTDRVEALATETVGIEQVLASAEYQHPDVLTQAVGLEDEQEREARAKAIVGKIDAHFSQDEQVAWIILGHKENLPAAQICELSGMTRIGYETARKRFRRGLNKLFPEKRTP